MFNIVKHRYWYFAISVLLIVPGLISLVLFGLRTGIDFAGGTVWDILVPDRTTPISQEEVRKVFDSAGVESSPQLSPPDAQNRVFISVRTPEVREGSPQKTQIQDELQRAFPGAVLVRFETVGATVSAESTRQAVLAVLAASAVILAYLTISFRQAPHPVRFGVAAIIAMLHDVLLVVGVASILGRLIGLQVDALFLTALLTVISFSVHDTIVVFDRVRENLHMKRSSESFEDVVNRSIVQTLSRSIITQMTVLFTLLALLLFGGPTIRHFILILTIGQISGSYSSIFNAAQLLVVWENGWGRDWRNALRRQEPVQGAAA